MPPPPPPLWQTCFGRSDLHYTMYLHTLPFIYSIYLLISLSNYYVYPSNHLSPLSSPLSCVLGFKNSQSISPTLHLSPSDSLSVNFFPSVPLPSASPSFFRSPPLQLLLPLSPSLSPSFALRLMLVGATSIGKSRSLAHRHTHTPTRGIHQYR